MKKIFCIFITSIIFVSVNAAESALSCSRESEIKEKIEEIDENLCNRSSFLELSAGDIFQLEIDSFDEKTVNKIMLDDISNPNWLSQKGIYDLRENKICLEKICSILWGKCSSKNNYSIDNDQQTWCEESVDNIFEIQKTKVKTAVLENQTRKTRSIKREKFRGIEVRFHRYFYNNLIDFANEFKIFTEKVTAFILKPL